MNLSLSLSLFLFSFFLSLSLSYFTWFYFSIFVENLTHTKGRYMASVSPVMSFGHLVTWLTWCLPDFPCEMCQISTSTEPAGFPFLHSTFGSRFLSLAHMGDTDRNRLRSPPVPCLKVGVSIHIVWDAFLKKTCLCSCVCSLFDHLFIPIWTQV